jgi:hypothetical protein
MEWMAAGIGGYAAFPLPGLEARRGRKRECNE